MAPPQRNKINGHGDSGSQPQFSGVSKTWRPVQPPRVTSQTSVNAPTSLTNLAQLSGITLVPVSSINYIPSNVIPTVPQRISANTTRHSQPQLIRQSASTNNIVVTNTASNSGQQRTLNPATLLPVQLLNHGISSRGKPGPPSWGPVSSTHLSRNLVANSVARGSSGTRANRPPNGQHLNQPIEEYVEEYPTYPDIRQAHTITELNQLMQRAPVLETSEPPENSNDMTLMKLMAILNNPALTITPVATPAGIMKGTDTPMMEPNDPAAIQKFISHDSHGSTVFPQSSMANSHMQKTSKTKARIPKSAANLQLLSSRTPVNHQDGNGTSSQVPCHERVEFHDVDGDNQVALDWLSSLAVSRMQSDDSSATLSWLPSTGVTDGELDSHLSQNETLSLETSEGRAAQTLSVQSLHQLASQAEAGNSQDNFGPRFNDSTILEPECLLSVPRVNVRQLDKGARDREIIYSVTVSSDVVQKRTHSPLRSSKQRLWMQNEINARKHLTGELSAIEVEAIEENEVLVSERHLMLERMVEIAETVGQRKQATTEPDDIFINRSKRIMSRIDTSLERKKRRRFERICDQSSHNDLADSDQSDDSDDDSIVDESANLFEYTVIPIQLPLDEFTTNQKREYLSSVGLISRHDKNKLSVRCCEERLRKISALALGETDFENDEEIQRFTDMIHKTEGTDIQLRTETSIKRNELPFIEGLNRNTSRIKMSYMSVLGLEKRSKRTTLYKVTKHQEGNQNQISKRQHQPKHQQARQSQQQRQVQRTKQPNDLIKPQHLHQPVTDQTRAVAPKFKKTEPVVQSSNSRLRDSMIAEALKLAQASCRGAMQAPNKDEYMKSLGLTAS